MKISQIIIKGFQQFQDFKLDLTDPQGKPLDRICFIGKNGTGKTTLLELVRDCIYNFFYANQFISIPYFIAIKIAYNSGYIYILNFNSGIYYINTSNSEKFEKSDWENLVNHCISDDYSWEDFLSLLNNDFSLKSPNVLREQLATKPEITNIPAENAINPFKLTSQLKNQLGLHENALYNFETNLPEANLNAALSLFSNFPTYHEITESTISEFWKLLIFNIKKREEQFNAYAEANQHLPYAQIKADFNRTTPSILDGLAELWNVILAEAGLEFDVEKAKNPIQLSDNLQAYIRKKASNNGTSIAYHELSTGIRNFIFKVGYLYALYFNRQIAQGFLLVDEPENSLYPSFIRILMDSYNKIIAGGNTQFFVATHSPLVAAQFEPYERIILDFDADGCVQAHKGNAAIGDDSNDILIKDFGTDAYNQHPKAEEAWNRFMMRI